jgi:hypothetical protein
MYADRKEYELNILTNDIKLLHEKMRFIEDVIEDKIVIYKQTKDIIISKLQESNYAFYENGKMLDYDETETITTHYNYLLNMSISQFTQDKIDELVTQINDKETEYTSLETTGIKDMWIQELELLEKDCKRII